MKKKQRRSTPTPQRPKARLEVQKDSDRPSWAFYTRPSRPTYNDEGGGLTLLEMQDLLRRSRWHMLIGALIFAVLAAAYLKLATPIYSVGAQLLVQRQSVLANQGERQSGTALFLATQAEIISSPLVIAAALDELPQAWRYALAGEGRDAVGVVASLVSATPVKGTNVLSLRYIGPSPDEGQSILKAVIGSYQNLMRDLDRTDHRKDLEVLAAYEATLRQQLEERNDQYSERHAANALAGAGPDGESMHESLLDRLSNELVAARARRIKLENEQFALNEHGHLSTDRRESRSRENLVEQLWRVEVKSEELRAAYGDEHPGVSAANQEVAALRRQLEKLKRQERAALEGEVEAARSTEVRLSEVYRQEIERAKGIEARSFEQRKLKDEIDLLAANHQRALADLRREELTQRGLAEGRARVSIQVLRPPTSPTSPMWPQPVLVVAPSVTIGALLGLGIAWFAGRLRDTDADWDGQSAVSPVTPAEVVEPNQRSGKMWQPERQRLGSGDD